MLLLTRLLFCLIAISVTHQCSGQVYYRTTSGYRVAVPARSAAAYRVYRPSYSSARTTSRTTSLPRTTSISRSTRSTPYRLDSGDVVAVIVQGVTGKFSEAPVHMPKNNDGTLPAVGHPIVVMRDGTLALPMIKPLYVRGMTVTQARDAASNAYLREEVLNKKHQVTMTLMRKRTISVNVLHDNPALAMRSVSQVKVEADRASALSALVGAGPWDRDAQVRVIKSNRQAASSRGRLQDGDVVHVKSKPAGYFFTGGNLRGGQYALPNNRPVNALQAMSIAGGIQQRTALGPREVIIVRRGGGAVRMSYAQLLNHPNSATMMPGDTLIVR